MSSFVAEYPVIRALLRRYHAHNIEYAAVAPFQSAFSVLFPVGDGYAVNMEQSVDRDRPRVDLYIQGLDFEHETLYPVMVGEGKGGGKSPREVETQVLERAREAITANALQGIHAFTWIGDCFRVWYVTAQDRVLEPQDGKGDRGHRHVYIPLDSREGDCIVPLTENMKLNRPLQQATVIPSQPLPAFEPEEEETEDNGGLPIIRPDHASRLPILRDNGDTWTVQTLKGKELETRKDAFIPCWIAFPTGHTAGWTKFGDKGTQFYYLESDIPSNKGKGRAT